MEVKFKKIGMRKIKTALSVMLCVVACNLMNMEYPFYAAIAAIIVMQGTVIDTYRTGRNRMLGTIVGAAIGLVCAMISPGSPVLCGIGIICIITICDALKWNKSVSIAGIVFMAIMVNLQGRSPWFYSVNRIIDTFVGIVIAVLVNYFVCPPKYVKVINDTANQLGGLVLKEVKDMICCSKKVNPGQIKGKIEELKKGISIYKAEIKPKNEEQIQLDKINELMNICEEVHMHMSVINSMEGEHCLSEENIRKLEMLFDFKAPYEKCDHVDENVIFNYHVGKIVDNLFEIQKTS